VGRGNAAFFAPATLALPTPGQSLLPLTNSSGTHITFYFDSLPLTVTPMRWCWPCGPSLMMGPSSIQLGSKFTG
jgi:hypothetical protein